MISLKVVDEASVNEGERNSRWLLGPWNSECTIDFGIAFIQPNQRVKKHFHEQVEEIFYVIEGEILLKGNNENDIILKQGHVVYLPPKQVHALHNRSQKIAKLVVIKVPSIPSDKKYVDSVSLNSPNNY